MCQPLQFNAHKCTDSNSNYATLRQQCVTEICRLIKIRLIVGTSSIEAGLYMQFIPSLNSLSTGLQHFSICENNVVLSRRSTFILFVIPYCFLLACIVTVAQYCIISEIKRDIDIKSRFFHNPAFDVAIRWFISKYCHNVWYCKHQNGVATANTRMVWLLK